jgi:hypothetical protein
MTIVLPVPGPTTNKGHASLARPAQWQTIPARFARGLQLDAIAI